MALYDDVVNFVWPNALVVVGVAVLAPVLLPAVGMCCGLWSKAWSRPALQSRTWQWVSRPKPGSR
jgi:hypothetical protein